MAQPFVNASFNAEHMLTDTTLGDAQTRISTDKSVYAHTRKRALTPNAHAHIIGHSRSCAQHDSQPFASGCTA